MIEDIIDKKLKEKKEYNELIKKLEKEIEKLETLYIEGNKTYRKDKRLEYFALLGQIITLYCCLASINALLSYIVLYFTKRKAKEITFENAVSYDKEILSLSEQIKREQKKLLNIYYNTCDEVEKELKPLKEEVKHHLINRNYETIMNNYHRYEDVLPLIENNGYYELLYSLIELGKRGKNINLLSKDEKQALDCLNHIANKLEEVYKDKKQETFGERQRRMDEKYLENKSQNFQKTYKKKR